MTTCSFFRLFRSSHRIKRYYCSRSLKEQERQQKPPPGHQPTPPDPIEKRGNLPPTQPPSSPQEPDHHPQETLSPPTRAWQLVSKKVINFVEQYEDRFKKKSPKLFDVYRTVKYSATGFRYLASDTHTYALTSTDIWLGKELHTFTRKELETYLEMPTQFIRIVPLMTFGILPVVGNLAFVIAYYFPKHLLTYQFWTEEQRLTFGKAQLKQRRAHLSHIYKDMHQHSTRLRGTLRETMMALLKKVEDSQSPTVHDVVESRPFFESPRALCLDRLNTVYFRRLAKTMNLSKRRSGLRQDGIVFLHIDRAMAREGFDNMTDEDIQKSCFQRGFDPNGQSREAQIAYLKTWSEITAQLDENSISLLLHLPVLLTYNMPTQHQPGTNKTYKKG